jgi:hypothetical protein
MLTDLPDEIIDHILTFVKERDIGRCRQVNSRLYQITNNPYLVKRFPHIYVDGSLYFKEQAYFTPTLLDRILITTKTNDLEWLVSRTTPIIREVFNGDMMLWGMMIDAAKYCARTSAWNSVSDTQDVAWNFAWDALFDATDDWDGARYAVLDAVWDVDHLLMDPVSDAYLLKVNILNAIEHAHRVGCRMVNTFHMVTNMNITTPFLIGLKCYQIHECKMLLSINKTLLSRIKDITDTHLQGITLTLSDEVLEELKDNPWIKQYQDLTPKLRNM